MPRISDIEILQKAEQPTLFIRTHARVDELPVLIGESMGKLAAYLEGIGELLADVPYVGYHTSDMQNLDVEIGFPVARPLPGTEGIQAGSLPAGNVIFCMYRGAYGELGPVYDEMSRWIEEHQRKAAGVVYEHYYNGPEFPESELLTMIVMPLE